MRLMQLGSKLKYRKFVTFLAVLALLCSVFSMVLPGPAGAANQANDSPNGLVPSLTVKVGTASVTNPTTIYTTARVFSPAEMTAMANVTQAYSYIDSFPTGVIDAAKGVKITDILAASGIDFSKVYRIYFYSNDVSNGPYTNLTKDYLWGSPRYYFPNIKNSWDYDTQSPSLSGEWGSPTDGAVPVDPILAVQDNWQRIFNIPEEGPLVDYSGQCNG
ncbi:hypothetical protein L9W92_15025, partial [Pelotomaculum terephthalicicum JT]|uniref:hypothetical protein n=1 Tax=Pelotomaculum terephthalicicum TaxID=206393 RepID=UPI001F036D4B